MEKLISKLPLKIIEKIIKTFPLKLKKLSPILLASLLCLLPLITTNSLADEAKERVYLTQLLNQLNAMQPLILAAQKEQPKNLRVQFHYSKFQDNQGQWHNGLLEDLQAIKAGIEEKLNAMPIEPRVVAPIAGDYLLTKGSN